MLKRFLDDGPPGTPDGVTPFFVEVGAAPTAGNAPYPPGSIARFGTTYYLQRGTLSAPVWSVLATVLAGTAGTDYAQGFLRDVYRARALAALSLSAGDVTVVDLFDDFVNQSMQSTAPTGWTSTLAGSGAVGAPVTGLGGGLIRVDSGATAGSTAEVSSNSQLPGNLTTTPWFLAVRMRLAFTPNADSAAGVGWRNEAANKTIQVGNLSALNPTNYIVQYDGNQGGSALDLGLALDLTFHIFEFWTLGDGTLRARADGGTTVTAAMVSAPADFGRILVRSRNNGSAAARPFDVDWVFSMTKRS
jgi:hypothetical protein